MNSQILATVGSSDWISSAACKIASMFVVWASEGGTAPAIPLGVLSWPGPAFLSCSLLRAARTSRSQLSRTLAMSPAPIRAIDARGDFKLLRPWLGSNLNFPTPLLWVGSATIWTVLRREFEMERFNDRKGYQKKKRGSRETQTLQASTELEISFFFLNLHKNLLQRKWNFYMRICPRNWQIFLLLCPRLGFDCLVFMPNDFDIWIRMSSQ